MINIKLEAKDIEYIVKVLMTRPMNECEKVVTEIRKQAVPQMHKMQQVGNEDAAKEG